MTISDEPIQMMTDIFPDSDELKKFEELAQGQALATAGRTLCYPDWGYPDGTSFVQQWGTHNVSKLGEDADLSH